MFNKRYLLAAVAIVAAAGSLPGFFSVPAAVAQTAPAPTMQVTGDAARAAIDTALKAGRITTETATQLTTAVGQGASVAVETATRALVLNQNIAAVVVAGGGFAGGTLAAGAFVAGAAAVVASGGGDTAGTTGTTGTR